MVGHLKDIYFFKGISKTNNTIIMDTIWQHIFLTQTQAYMSKILKINGNPFLTSHYDVVVLLKSESSPLCPDFVQMKWNTSRLN